MDLDKEKSDVLRWLVFISEYNLMQLQQRFQSFFSRWTVTNRKLKVLLIHWLCLLYYLPKKYLSFTSCFPPCPSAGNAIQAFGNGTDVGVWQPMSPVQTTTSTTTPYQRNRERNPNTIDNHINADTGIYHFCGNLQVRNTRWGQF